MKIVLFIISISVGLSFEAALAAKMQPKKTNSHVCSTDKKFSLKQLSAKEKKLRNAVLKVQNKFADVSNRKKHSANYYQDLKSALLQTTKGKALIGCFEKKQDSRINKSFSFILSDQAATSAAFTILADPAQPQNKFKNIEFSSAEEPITALAVLAHEMQHSCSASQMLDNEQLPAGEEYDDLADQDLLVDELKAYKTETQVFTEIAKTAPDLVCNKKFNGESLLFKKNNLKLHQQMAMIEKELQKGTFYKRVIQSYSDLGIFKNPNRAFYSSLDKKRTVASVSNDTEQKLKPNLVSKIKQSGFEIKD